MGVVLRKRKLKSGKVSLYLDIYQNGQRNYEYLFIAEPKDKQSYKETLQLAKSIEAKRKIELQNETYGFAPKFKRKADFVEFCKNLANEKSETEKAWHTTIKHLKTFTGGSIQFGAVNELWLESFKAYLEKNLSPNTAHTYFSKIKAALKQALRQSIITINPAERVSQVRKVETKREFLTYEEIQRIADFGVCRNPVVKRAFLFACFSGLRLSDVEGLTWQNVRPESLEFIQRKTKAVEYLPLSGQSLYFIKEAWEAATSPENGGVEKMPELTAKVFPLPSRTEITDNLKMLSKSAGVLKNVTFHVARHTFATMSLTFGTDLYTVSKLLGHKSIQITQVYGRIIDQKKREAVNRLPMLNSPKPLALPEANSNEVKTIN